MFRYQLARTVSFSVLMAAALVVTACAADDDAPVADDGPDDPDVEVDGGVLRVALDRDLPALEPLTAGAQPANPSTLTISQHIFDPLVRFDGDDFVPMLAESWDNPDDRTWVFTLREGVEFHDGTPLTANDVKVSLEIGIEEHPNHYIPLWGDLEIEATDDRTVTIQLEEPRGTVLSAASMLFVGPADRLDDEEYPRSPVGTGAFKVEEFLPDDRLTLTRNENYWGDVPSLEELELLWIPEVAGRMTALSTGEIDVTWNISSDQVETILGMTDVEYDTGDSYTYYFNWFNVTEEPFDDVRVRRAMWHAIDLDSVVGDLFGDMADVARAPITQAVFGAPQLEPYEYNPDLARQLLAEAGYPDGFETSIQWRREAGPNINALGTTLISYWADIGVTVEAFEREGAEFQIRSPGRDDYQEYTWDMTLHPNQTLSGDADWTLGRLYLCEADRTGYCNGDLDELLYAAQAAVDPAEREELYAAASEIIWEDAVGIFPIDLTMNAAWRSRVSGFEVPLAMPRFHEVSVTD